MELKRFRLINFRQFKDLEIEFSRDPLKPFTVVLGRNTYGKTTLVKAFLWCLYGNARNDFKDKILLNKDVSNSMGAGQKESKEVKATLEFEHNGYSYKVTTKESYIKASNGKVQVFNKTSTSLIKIGDSGNSIPIISESQIKEEIEKNILDPELSSYFFFDGETNSIETITKKSNLTNAVSNLMGIQKIEKIKKYYNPTAQDNVNKRLSNKLVSSNEIEVIELQGKLDKYQKELEIKNNEFITLDQTLSELNTQVLLKESELDANKDVLEYQNEKRNLFDNIEKNKLQKNEKFNKVITSFCQSNLFLNSLFAYSFINSDMEVILNQSDFHHENSISHISEEAIDEIIERGYCLCGTKIENKGDAYEHLIDTKNYIAPRNYGKYVQDFIDNEQTNINYNIDNLNAFFDLCCDVTDLIAQIDEDNSRLNSIKQKIEGRVDAGALQKSINEINRQIGAIGNQISYLQSTIIPSLEKNIETISQKIRSFSLKSNENDYYNECIRYADYIYKLACEKIVKEKKKIRNSLEETVGNIFTDIYHGNRKIVIDDSFTVKPVLVNATSDKLDTSKGLETVTNFSFVAGLMKLAKDKLNEIDDDLSDEKSDEIYPLVMDALFSHTDDIHIKNICVNLSKYCNQIVIIVMEKDYNIASADINDKIGRKYRIIKESEIMAHLEEEEI